MVEEGEQAPRFELPGVVDGEFETVALEEHLGEDVVILAFYPGDFNPACTDESTDLDELDLFRMQKDVTVLAFSGDSVFSHRAFAREYDLHIPLLSDTDGDVAAAYGVDVEEDGAGYQTRRAVVVVDHSGTVEYAWVADDVDDLPNTDSVRETIEGVGGDETAQARYRVGHAHYIEGRRAFTKAMKSYEGMEWMMAQSDFTQAHGEFDEAKSEFNTAVRFGEDEETLTYFDRAEQKAEALWRAAEWLSESASAFASGEGAEAEKLRRDAETPLETARDVHEPPSPDDFPPEEDPAEQAEKEVSILPDDEEEVDASLGVDIDEESTTQTVEVEDEPTADDSEPQPAAGEAGPGDEEEAESSIDDDELEEIAAELEQQTEAAEATATEEIDDGNVVPEELELGDGADSGPSTDGETVDGPADDGLSPGEAATQNGTDSAVGTGDDAANSATDPDGDEMVAAEENQLFSDDRSESQTSDETAGTQSDEAVDENDIELDLTDPTEGEDYEPDDEADIDEDEEPDEADDDLDEGDHGVPDSL